LLYDGRLKESAGGFDPPLSRENIPVIGLRHRCRPRAANMWNETGRGLLTVV